MLGAYRALFLAKMWRKNEHNLYWRAVWVFFIARSVKLSIWRRTSYANSPRLSDGPCAIVGFGSFNALMMVRYDLAARAVFVLRECLTACAVTTRIMCWADVVKGCWRIHGWLAG